jgi:predicted NAD-dependent protein-ADP-ribosyltransferase YbiA (DUF1768 family)
MSYDKVKNGWNRDWETDNIPDDMTGEHSQLKCWLIEGAGVYWHGRSADDFQTDVHDAVKFADRVAAERILHWMLPEQYQRTCRAVEHVFGLEA